MYDFRLIYQKETIIYFHEASIKGRNLSGARHIPGYMRVFPKCHLVRIPLLLGGGVARSDGVVGRYYALFSIGYILPTTSPFGYSSSQEEENSVTTAFWKHPLFSPVGKYIFPS